MAWTETFHPTTGGVFASWASLGHITLAEPGALIGFLGPRVLEALQGNSLPDGVQTAENLRAHGLVDAVITTADLATYVGRVLNAITPAPNQGAALSEEALSEDKLERVVAAPTWESVLRTRETGHPGGAELIRAAAGDIVPLRETGMILALARAGVTRVSSSGRTAPVLRRALARCG